MSKEFVREFGFMFKYEHFNKDGELLWSQDWSPNQFTDDGFESMFDLYFRDEAAPTGFKVGLVKTGEALSQDDSIGDVVEPDNAGEGYARQSLDRDEYGFVTLALDNNDMQIVSDTVQFHNTDGAVAWEAVIEAFLEAEMAGTNVLVCWQELSTTRTLQPGDKMNVTMKMKGKQPTE